MSNERVKKYLQTINDPGNEEKLAEHREKHRIAQQKYREKKIIEDEVKYRNKRNEISKRSYENVQKEEFNEKHSAPNDIYGYTTSQGLSAAVRKVETTLPKGKQKIMEVLKTIAKKLNFKFNEDHSQPKVRAVSEKQQQFKEIEKKVKEFYEADIVSRAMPGKKDFVKIKIDDGSKELRQKRLMLMTIHNAYELFKEKFPDLLLCESKFYQLRPQHVILTGNTPHEMCLCSYCENFHFLFLSLKPFFKFDIPDVKSLMQHLICENTFLCASNECERCDDSEEKLKLILLPACNDEIIVLRKWIKMGTFVQKMTLPNQSVSSGIDEFNDTFDFYKLHRYLIHTQSQFVYNLKEKQPSNHVTLHMDYSMNFTTTSSREVQSAFFTRKQISIHTAVAYVGQSAPISFAICNDDTKHAKQQVFFYIKLMIEILKEKFPDIVHISFVTDGCAAQYKNKDTLSNLLFTQQDFGVTAEWHFMPTSHGKSAADGIGGNVKRLVHQEIISGRAEVNNANEFVQCAKSVIKSTNIIHVCSDDIKPFLSMLNSRWRKVTTLQGTRNFHFFLPLYPDKILASVSSLQDNVTEFKVL
jgi:hypothetical protein